jgi:hypothetical protein
LQVQHIVAAAMSLGRGARVGRAAPGALQCDQR